jgi:hypothetical protein
VSTQESRPVTGGRRFSHAIAEGDGISVIAAVADAKAARAAEAQRAEALIVGGDPADVKGATALPILWRSASAPGSAAGIGDAVTLSVPADPEDEEEAADLERQHDEALALGLDCAIEVRSEEELGRALELIDPEIFLLAPPPGAPHERLEAVLDLLAEVPAGKLAIADLAVTTEDEVQELERAGVDAVIVREGNVADLIGETPPEV